MLVSYLSEESYVEKLIVVSEVYSGQARGVDFYCFRQRRTSIHLPVLEEVLEELDIIRSQIQSIEVLSRVGRGDDFEDEVYFKRGRVVTPRFLDFDQIGFIYKN